MYIDRTCPRVKRITSNPHPSLQATFSSMRPLPGGSDALPPLVKPRSRKASMDHAAPPSNNGPTTFFMRTEQEMEQSLASSQSTHSIGRQRDSTYGVQSLADTLEAAFGVEGSAASQGKSPVRSGSHSSSADSTKSPASPLTSPLKKLKRKLSGRTTSAPLTPLNIDVPSPLPTSAAPSTPTSVSLQSLKLSDEGSVNDETGSQVITSSGDEDDVGTQQGASSSFPQLVMPSIQMPTRRPFTTKGKSMGKLKVLVAGRAGQSPFFTSQCICRVITSANVLRQRYWQDVAHSFHRAKLRRHRTRRPLVALAIALTAAPTEAEVTQAADRTRRNNETHGNTRKHSAIPILVDGCRRDKSIAQKKEQR